MNRCLLGMVLGLGAATFASSAFAQPAVKPVWMSDYTKAMAEAKRTGKILFVVFRCQP